MPASVPVGTHAILDTRSALDIVVPADRVVIITSWEQARRVGIARAGVRLAAESGSATVFFVDARHSHGVYLAVVLLDVGSDGQTTSFETTLIPPRVCRVRKNELAVILDIDDATTKILGWTARELVERRSLEFIHPEDRDRAVENWMEMLARPGGEHRWRGRHQHHDGSWVWMEITNRNLLDDAQHSCVLAEMVDISDEMAAQEALRAREQLLHRMAEALPIGLFQVDRDRSIVYANSQLFAILGLATAGRVDELSTIVAEDRLLFDRSLDGVLTDGRDADLDVRIASPDERCCAMTLRALTDEAGSVTGAIVSVADVTESARMRAELERRATFDALTGCYNRAAVMSMLERCLRTQDERDGLALVFVDLDGFKAVNDRLGHAAGDDLLKIVAHRVGNTVRALDSVGRLGGDEFLVVCPNITSLDEAGHVGERIADALRHEITLAGERISLRASVGVAWRRTTPDCWQVPARTAESLVATADAAMYESKRHGAAQPVTCVHPATEVLSA
jgi:diguanylate cyclase (GGDEF)-like protein/PAS domain S-box-containing protein